MNTNANIIIQADGAGQAAAALDSVSGGFEKIGQQHEGLKGKFQERFQHLGLQLFAGEALRAQGVGMETRQVVNTLNLGLSSLLGAGTAAASGIILAVTALAAIAGIIQKVIEHQSKMNEETQKQIKANDGLIKNYEQVATTMKTYGESTAKIPGYIREWATAEKELNDQIVLKQNAALLSNIAILNNKKVVDEDAVTETKRRIAALDGLYEAEKLGNLEAGSTARAAIELNKTLNQQQQALARTSAELRKAESDVVALHNGFSDAADAAKHLSEAAAKAAEEQAKYAAKSAEEQTKEFQELGKEHAKSLQKQLEDENAYYQELARLRQQNGVKIASQVEMEETTHFKMKEVKTQIAKNGYDEILNAQSQAFAQMIVHGKSFAQATAHMWSDLAAQVIAQIEMMIVKYLVLLALTGGTGSFATGSVMGKIFNFAEGGSVMVNKPTMFLAGEGGEPEVATFTPLSKMGGAAIGSPQYMGSGSGSSLSIGNIVTYVTGVQDPQAIAAQVGQAIVSRIRGRGDLNFVRA